MLSENTGAHEEVGDCTLTVNPFDIQEQADAMYRALTMEAEERRLRAERLRVIVDARDPGDWVDEQLADIRAKPGAPAGRIAGDGLSERLSRARRQFLARGHQGSRTPGAGAETGSAAEDGRGATGHGPGGGAGGGGGGGAGAMKAEGRADAATPAPNAPGARTLPATAAFAVCAHRPV